MLPLLIIVIGIILIFLNLKAIKKEDKSFEKILAREEENNNKDYDIEILKIRKDIAETVLELQREIEELKLSINSSNKLEIKNYNKNDKNESNLDKDIISEIDFSNKIESNKKENFQSEKQKKVKLLLDKGLTDNEICEKLNIGKGEVLLIKSLLKR
ncbi:hypothetical protein H9660_09120 [Clostridium sp. Sa3CUN1]|uniref:Uncharacterized protein n=1 Tax=Clostridium gallinarum TaxID=2762246 RepID=A0ABR8Q4E7_9CLOT|nr:hypothetical protein [Clostridium gallinarum]MBD7915307.1 hypothetical protein [Clostridium gallinarum]